MSAISVELIAKLANVSFEQGCFPAKFKSAAITPVLKKSGLDKKLPVNYRPISNLNNISKILEKLFLVRFQPHVTASPNYNPYQSAYRKKHSTETALTLTLDNIFHASDRSKSTILVALDLSAAFDLVDHELLISRLKTSFGIDGLVLQWILSYLSDRSQFVSLGSSTSPPTRCSIGVPQGSVLGPLFFTLYISPLAKILSNHGISHQQFADDTQLFIAISPNTAASKISQVELCLTDLHTWFCCNGLALNADKSDCIILGTVQRAKTFAPITSINAAGSVVPISSTIKTLGVTLDSHLTFEAHVKSLTKTCYFHIRALRHIRSSIDLETAKSVANAIVSSRLDYANSLLCGISGSNLLKLQRVQNSLARVDLATTHTRTDNALNVLHWLPIHHRISFKIASLTYKVLNSKEPSYLADLLSPYVPARTLRSSNSNFLVEPMAHTVFGSRAFRSAAPKIWNRLPDRIRSACSFSAFKTGLKTHLFCQP